jgi:protein-S-isoprenylcysteine O-methyltransferase Ste14
MRASQFEFRHRFWIFGLLYYAGFALYGSGDKNALVSVIHYFAPETTDAGYHIAFAMAALVMMFAALLRTWATAYLSTEVMKHGQLHSATLVADGPYRYVRNPLYLGNIMMAVSFGALATRVGAVIMIVGIIVFCLRLISREEGQLEAEQGQSFRRFREAVPRLIPSLTPRLPSSGRRPRWKQAFAGESMMWGFFITTVIFAVTLHTGKAFFIALVLSIASTFLFRGNESKETASAGTAK